MNDRLATEHRIVERYVAMADASSRMLAAAREDDWDGVCAVEKECAGIIAELSTIGDLSPADPGLRRQKFDLMRRVLADDAELRLLTQPWMRKLETMMKTSDTSAKLGRTYGGQAFRD